MLSTLKIAGSSVLYTHQLRRLNQRLTHMDPLILIDAILHSRNSSATDDSISRLQWISREYTSSRLAIKYHRLQCWYYNRLSTFLRALIRLPITYGSFLYRGGLSFYS